MTEPAPSVESPLGWRIAVISMLVMGIGFGGPYVTIVALKPIAAEFDWPRSIPSFASAVTYIGAGLGGILMGWYADRVGVAWVVLIGATMIGLGAIVASYAEGMGQLYFAHGVLFGFFGNATTFAPLMANITRWFDRRRGVAVAVVGSGQSIGGMVWPPILRYSVDEFGWRSTMFWWGVLAISAMVPLCFLLRHRPPVSPVRPGVRVPEKGDLVLGLPGNLVQLLLCLAIAGCCVAMAMPMTHIVAYCTDLGISAARGAEMLSLLLGSAFLSRLYWGQLSDRIGGLKTILYGGAGQAVALAFYIFVDGVVPLYVLSMAFGLAFGGIVPAYSLVIREVFPLSDIGWRMGALYLFGTLGMALGAWLGGVIFDAVLDYKPAFLTGVLFNLANVAIIGWLVWRRRGHQGGGVAAIQGA
ncbi:MAG: MFS transporter [Alphaproteobacteria bacterium]|nr:MFS transporter [Alphaproteobacteria bacterium]